MELCFIMTMIYRCQNEKLFKYYISAVYGKKNQKNSRFMFVVYGVLAPSEKNLPLTVFNFTVRLAIHGGALSRKRRKSLCQEGKVQ